MSTNDQIILNQILDQRRRDLAPDISESTFFEFFTAEQALKDFDLSYDEIDSGLVGDGGDGGIDGLYVLVNGDLVQEDDYATTSKQDVTLDLIYSVSSSSWCRDMSSSGRRDGITRGAGCAR